MKDHGGFDHNRQSLRIVTKLEQRYPDFHGLNLTWETREGILKHGARWEHPVPLPDLGRQRALEAQVADVAVEPNAVAFQGPYFPGCVAADQVEHDAFLCRAIEVETLLDDNAIEFSVRVMPEEIRVLYVDGYPRWEYRFLKELLKRADENIEVQVFLLLEGSGNDLALRGMVFAPTSPGN